MRLIYEQCFATVNATDNGGERNASGDVGLSPTAQTG